MAENLALQDVTLDAAHLGFLLERVSRDVAGLHTAFANAMCTYEVLLDSIKGIRVLDEKGAITWRPDGE